MASNRPWMAALIAIAGGASLAPAAGASTVPTCRASALKGTLLTPFDGAAGTFGTVIVITNVGAQRCALSGRPTVTLLDASGRRLSGHQTARPGPAHRVVLARGGRAGAELVWHGSPDEPGPISRQCLVPKTLAVAPTGAGGAVRVRAGMTICDPPGAFNVAPFGPPPFRY